MKLKDGRTHFSYKAEHAVDLENDLVVAAEIYAGDTADGDSVLMTVQSAQDSLAAIGSTARVQDVVGDKGYHRIESLAILGEVHGVRTYIPERQDGVRHNWRLPPAGDKVGLYGNRRRVTGTRGRALNRLRREFSERSFARTCETRGARRSWLRGTVNIAKRYVVHAAARTLGVIMRALFGVGSPRSLQGRMRAGHFGPVGGSGAHSYAVPAALAHSAHSRARRWRSCEFAVMEQRLILQRAARLGLGPGRGRAVCQRVGGRGLVIDAAGEELAEDGDAFVRQPFAGPLPNVGPLLVGRGERAREPSVSPPARDSLNREMEVHTHPRPHLATRAGGPATGVAHGADHLAAAHRLTCFNAKAVKVSVGRGDVVGRRMAKEDQIAVPFPPAGVDDHPVEHRVHLRAASAGDIERGVNASRIPHPWLELTARAALVNQVLRHLLAVKRLQQPGDARPRERCGAA